MAATWVIAARLMPRWVLECMDSADAERAADRGEFAGVAQPAPVVVVGEHDLDGVPGERLLDLGEGRHAHVGGQRHVGLRGDLGHGRRAERRVLQVLQDVARAPRPPSARSPRDQAPLGSSRSGCPGNASASARDRGDLLVRREDAALELEGGEAVALVKRRACSTTPAGSRAAPQSSLLGGDALGVRRPTCRRGTRCTRRASRTLPPSSACTGSPSALPERVEAGDLEGRRRRTAAACRRSGRRAARRRRPARRPGSRRRPPRRRAVNSPFRSLTWRPSSFSANGRASSRYLVSP